MTDKTKFIEMHDRVAAHFSGESIMTWDYRVVRHVVASLGETYYQIHEVYYDENGKIVGMTEDGIHPLGETTTELLLELNRMIDCMSKPVLDYGVTDGKPEDWKED